ncbi:MAG: type IV pilin protein [Pseudomonadota bacterium]
MLTLFSFGPKRKGFTLVELLIAMAIVGILAAIAIPSYQKSVVRSKRVSTQEFMLELANRQTQYFADTRSYGSRNAAGSVDDLHMTVPTAVSAQYTITAVPDNAAVPPTYLITATPVATGSQVSDGALTIDHKGAKTPADKW